MINGCLESPKSGAFVIINWTWNMYPQDFLSIVSDSICDFLLVHHFLIEKKKYFMNLSFV